MGMTPRQIVPQNSVDLAEDVAVMAHERVVAAQRNLDQALAQRRASVMLLREAGWSFARIGNLLGVTKTAAANICRDV